MPVKVINFDKETVYITRDPELKACYQESTEVRFRNYIDLSIYQQIKSDLAI